MLPPELRLTVVPAPLPMLALTVMSLLPVVVRLMFGAVMAMPVLRAPPAVRSNKLVAVPEVSATAPLSTINTLLPEAVEIVDAFVLTPVPEAPTVPTAVSPIVAA